MKQKIGLPLVLAAAGLLTLGCTSSSMSDRMLSTPSLVVTTPVVTLAPGGTIMMYGTGFTPGQEVTILLADPGGGMSGISGSVAPAPVPNKDGAWAASFDFSAYVSVLQPGTGMISVVDANFKTLARVPVVFRPKPAAPKPEAAKPEAAKPGAKPPATK